MDGILVWMVPRLGDQTRNIMNRDDAVKQHHDYEKEQAKCEIIQKRIV
jgi:hypothetical protein